MRRKKWNNIKVELEDGSDFSFPQFCVTAKLIGKGILVTGGRQEGNSDPLDTNFLLIKQKSNK